MEKLSPDSNRSRLQSACRQWTTTYFDFYYNQNKDENADNAHKRTKQESKGATQWVSFQLAQDRSGKWTVLYRSQREGRHHLSFVRNLESTCASQSMTTIFWVWFFVAHKK